MTNIFHDVRRLVLAAIDDLAAAGGAAAGPRSVAGRGRAAARPRPWRSRDQCGDGAGGRGQAKPDGACPPLGRSNDAPTSRRLPRRGVAALLAAPPGFLNIRLAPAVWHAQLRAILRAGAGFGDSAIGGGERVNVEFVSANPTGPMHVGHGRGAVVGDALAALLAKAGFAVDARILHQRCRRPGRHPRPLAPSALPRGAGRGRSGRSRKGSIRASI